MIPDTRRKKIKILSRGIVLTSRGMARTPIDRPYLETINAILILISKYEANVVEVLPDGTEVKLTVNNFNTDNTIAVEPKPVAPIETPVVEAKEVIPAPTNPHVDKQLSRKERKRLEYEKKLAQQETTNSTTLSNTDGDLNNAQNTTDDTSAEKTETVDAIKAEKTTPLSEVTVEE